MYKNRTVLGVITARGGSKGIHRKNIKDLAGFPLIAYTIEAAKNSRYFDYFLVSTDDAEIADVSRKFGAPVPFMRPPKLSTDTAKSIPVIQHAISWLKEHDGRVFDYVMILQPTSPLRTAEDIDKSIEKIVDTGADSVMGMKKLTDFSLAKLKVLDGDKILPLSEDESGESTPRSGLKDVYKRNCAVYLTKTELIMAGDLFGKDSRAYVMPEERSVDINTPSDFELAEFLIKRCAKIENCILCGGNEIEILNKRGILEKGKPDRNFDNVICKKCGLVFISPQPERREYAAIYKEYEKNRHNCGAEEIGGMAEIMAGKEKTGQIYGFVKEYLGDGKKILDIGAGFGQISRALRDEFGCDVLAIEPSERLSAALKEKFGVPVFHGEFDDFLQSGSGVKFDLLILSHVFEHFTDPEKKLRQFKNLLKEGGAVYVEVPSVYSFKKPVDHFFDYCHPYNYSPKTLKELVYKNGFKIIKLNKDKKYRLQVVLAPQESGYPDAGEDDFWKSGSFKDTKKFIFRRRVIDWLRVVFNKIRGL